MLGLAKRAVVMQASRPAKVRRSASLIPVKCLKRSESSGTARVVGVQFVKEKVVKICLLSESFSRTKKNVFQGLWVCSTRSKIFC